MPTPRFPQRGTTAVSGTQTLAPGKYGDISLGSKDVLTLTPGVYNINSISESGQSQVAIAADPITGLYGPVIINVTGNNQSSPINLSGNGISTPTLDPSLMQFIYAGTGTITIVANSPSAPLFYTPN